MSFNRILWVDSFEITFFQSDSISSNQIDLFIWHTNDDRIEGKQLITNDTPFIKKIIHKKKNDNICIQNHLSILYMITLCHIIKSY